MTVASAANKVTLNGNGATTAWPFSFRIFDSSDLEIYKTDTSGVQTEITSNFSVVVNGESGGTVTYPSTGSPLASGETITIVRVTVRAQSVDFTSQGAFLPQNHEDADDRAMMILQELDEKIDRAFKLPTSDTSGTATELTTDVTGSAGGVLYIQAGVLKLSDSANIDDLETLAGISGDITTVAANDANITTVADNLNGTNTIGTVAGSVANVNNVGNNISNVVAVDGNEANINAAVANATNINTVAGISANVTTVAGISADVTAVAADAADIGVVSSNIADVNTVAGISANVTTVATDTAAINTVATDLTGDDDIGTVATNISNVNAVGSNISDITNAVSQAAAGVQRNTHTGDNSTVTFTLPATPWVADVVFAYLDGVNQDNSEWSVSGSDITFNTAPGTGVNIELVVLTAGTVTAAQTNASNAAVSAANAAASAASAAAAANEIGLVDTIAELKALTGGVNEVVEVKGHTAAGDGGGGLFIWDASDTTADDNGVYIQPNAGGTGRWIRQAPEGVASPLWFGAVVDGSTDDSTKLQAAIDFLETHYSGGTVNLPEGSMVVDDIDLISQLTLKGLGADVSVLKLPDSSPTANPMFATAGNSTNSVRGSDHIVFEDFTIDGNTANQTVERWLQDWSDNSAVTDPENDYTANGGGIGDTGAANIADDDYIATSQSGTASVALTLANTTMPVATVVTATTFAASRRIRVVSAGDDSGITFAVVGTDFAGNALNETITGANAGTADGSKWFKTVTSVTPSGNTASTVEVGIEEYDIGSAASAGRRNPNYTTIKTLANFDQVRAATINRLYVKNHKGTGFNDRGCLGFTVENCVFEDVGKNDGPYFPIWSQGLGTVTGDQAFFSESDGLRVRNNIATKLERGFVIFNSLAGGLIENNIVDGYGEAAIFAGSLNAAPSDTDGLITSTTPSGAGSITLDGVRVDSGTAYFTNARTITITSAANETARTFTITGTDARGEALTDTVTGANAGEARSNRRFLTVTDVSVDAATAGAIEVGCDRIYSTASIRGNTFRNGILTDIASYGVELNAGARDITIEDNLFEEIDEGAIAAVGVKNTTITRNTFRNCYAASLSTIPYAPFSERFGFNIGAAPIAGDAISRSSGYYIAIGTQNNIGGENVLITDNFAEEERSPDAPFILAQKSGDNNLSGYHVVTGNMLVSDTAWDVCDYTTTANVFSDDGKLNIWNNQGDLEDNGDGYKARFTDLTVDTDGLVYDSATGHVGVGTASPGRKFEVSSSNNVPARFVSTAASCRFRMVASGTTTGANEPEISVVNNILEFRTNNTTHLQCDGAGNVNVPSGVYEVSGTQVVGSQGSAIASLTDSTGGTTDGTLAAISGTSVDSDLNNNFSELHTKLDAVLSAMRTHGLIAT